MAKNQEKSDSVDPLPFESNWYKEAFF